MSSSLIGYAMVAISFIAMTIFISKQEDGKGAAKAMWIMFALVVWTAAAIDLING